MKAVVSKKMVNVINAIVFLIAGILFCISVSLGETYLWLVLGIGVLLIGLIIAVGDFLQQKSLITRTVIIGSLITAFGIYLLVHHELVATVMGLIPYVLIVAGACIFLDSFLLHFVRDKGNTKVFVLEFVVGIACIVFGILMLAVNGFKDDIGIVFGIFLILYSVYILFYTLLEDSKRKKGSK
ncbi:MAG TPA: hypothetical protein DIC18_00890 [Clostridiales bacterium]|nr:hypothetical protein [Clostridiales bacterium]HCU55872.1 hypothetical protein [Clostridiales bacterium]